MADVIGPGTCEHREHTDVLRFTLNLAYPVHQVWPAVATPVGLRGWLAVTDPLEPRLGGAVTLRWQLGLPGGHAHALDLRPDTRAGPGAGAVSEGTVTAWDLEHVAEYTVGAQGRIRFHLAPAGTTNGTVLRFTNEVATLGEAERLSRLAGWHEHLEYLVDFLDGRRPDWSARTLERYRELYAAYEAPGGRQS
ncbi:SRPBCC domain-containing protein [Streptomyces sp. ISL-96]|uniref:SRPBCC domain-containing protein n=1 Tax=Streptomyces sp. ISL-96 TaxID=2819191 RepID=UPI001BE8E8AE|nr:SRPBCC domain-containing protein [Streptomyces sp. ISL-96]MBT2493041.1 SRPBCC domain-containing protein [Streptomyces sp. ISL-96]